METACLAIAASVAGAELLLWLFPVLRPIGPPGWPAMVGNSAAGMLLAALGTWLSGEHLHSRNVARWIGISAAVLLMVLGMLILAEYKFGIWLGIDRLFPSSASGLAPRFPGRPAPQTAFGFVLLGASLVLVRPCLAGWRSKLTDAVVVSLLAFVLVMCGGYLYAAARLVGVDPSNLTARQTLVCFALLTFVLVGRRARTGGPLRVLLSVGIGGQAIRVLLPAVFLFPFLIFGSVGYLIEHWAVPIPFARAFAAAACALAGLFLVVWLTLRINALESKLRDMALKDELTGILNRRGFDFLAEHALHEARRNHQALAVLYLDLDHLKETNDRFGHDVGSQFIVDMADLLRRHFRQEDVVARIGGDEFAVLVHGAKWEPALAHLSAAAHALNRSGKRPYKVQYSVGEALFDPSGKETLEELVARADAKMYADKLARKTGNAQEKRETTEV